MSNKPESNKPSNKAKSSNSHSHSHSHAHHHATAGQQAHVDVKRAHSHSAEAGGGHDFDLPIMPAAVDVFDTTLRDGSQQEGLSLTVDDKLRVAEQLDHLGVSFIEGGWPGANPKDEEFFARAPKELHLTSATLVAFGSTRRAGVKAENDETLRQLVNAQTEAVCIVAKSSEMHVVDALRTSLDEAVAMVADSVDFLRQNDLRVFLDAEHFFDGYKANPEFTMRILRAAEEAGAETLVLCDTNGGTLPYEVAQIVPNVLGRFETQVGVHFHNDSGCAVANSLAAVGKGATHVQGCVNGYGERSGNADLAAAIPNLSLKLNVATIPAERLELLTPVSHHIAELVNIAPEPATALRGLVGLRPQGGIAHQRHRPEVGRVRAHQPRAGRERDPLRGLRDGRPLDAGPQGRGARVGARFPIHDLGTRLTEAAGERRLSLRGGGRLLGALAPGFDRLEAGLLRAGLVPGHL